MTIQNSLRSLLFLLGTLALVPASHAETRPEARVAISSTKYFEFFSDFSMNLHDALLTNGKARASGQQELFSHSEQRRCFDALTKEEQMGWSLAVAYYAETISPGSYDDRHQLLQRLTLIYGGADWAKEREQRLSAVAAGLREAAAPAYRQCYWDIQDALNRTWAEHASDLLAEYEDPVAEQLFAAYQTSWTAVPIPIDIVATVDWAGANTLVLNPPPGHVMISSVNALNQGLAALEIVFHEASHLLALYDSPLQNQLRTSNRVHGKTDSPLWHSSLFYITGEVVRSVYADRSGSAYRPYVYQNQLYSPALLEALTAAWRPYLNGKVSLADAVDTLVRRTSNLHE